MKKMRSSVIVVTCMLAFTSTPSMAGLPADVTWEELAPLILSKQIYTVIPGPIEIEGNVLFVEDQALLIDPMSVRPFYFLLPMPVLYALILLLRSKEDWPAEFQRRIMRFLDYM